LTAEYPLNRPPSRRPISRRLRLHAIFHGDDGSQVSQDINLARGRLFYHLIFTGPQGSISPSDVLKIAGSQSTEAASLGYATVRYHSLASANSGRPIVRWPAGSGPLVYVSFGTVLGYMSHATGVFRAALDALDELPVRALLTVGRRFDPALLGLVPPNVRIEPWVDQADVLGQVGLVVCHGGSGTVLGALAAGVPLVVVPLFADQFANARRVADCGAGIVVVGTGTKEENQNPIGFDMAPRLANAISIVLADRASYRSAAVQVAEEISSSPLPADLLNRFLR
jgi:UDP:flavonoid glycosyltransferase YjiC (YdhE family)